MANNRLIIPNIVKNSVDKLPKPIKSRLVGALQDLKKSPEKSAGYYKFGLGDHRLVYSYDSENKTVVVVKIEHRLGVFK